MRNNIIFKFIAVLLCAAALLGTVGSAAGILVLTEGDLYNRSVEEMREDELQIHGQMFAQEAALHYASTVLGGIPEEVWEDQYGSFAWPTYFFRINRYGYVLKAEDGTVLESANVADLENPRVLTFPVTGQYMHLVSAEPRFEAPTEPVYSAPEPGFDLYDAIPEGGTTVTNMTVTFADGSSEGVGSTPALGFLYYGDEGQVTFRSFDAGIFDPAMGTRKILSVTFTDESENMVYFAASESVVGYLSFDENGYAIYTAEVSGPQFDVYAATFLDENGNSAFHIESENPVGRISYDDEGYMYFHVYHLEGPVRTEGTIAGETCYGLKLMGANGRIFHSVYSEKGIGTLNFDADNFFIVFASDYPETGTMTTRLDNVSPVPPTIFTDPYAETSPMTTPTEVTVPPTMETVAPEETASTEATEATESTEVTQALEETAAAETVAETAAETTEETEATEAAETTEETQPEETEEATVPATEEPTVPPTEDPTVPPTEEDIPAPTEPPQYINGKPLSEYHDRYHSYYVQQGTGTEMKAEYVYVVMPEYTVELHLAEDALAYDGYYTVLTLVQQYRSYLLPILAVCLLVFAIFAVYLCCAAGRKPGSDEVKAGGLNCLPLDLYFILLCSVITVACVGIAEGGNALFRQNNILVGSAVSAGLGLMASLTVVGFCFAVVAQIKTPGRYWWHNSLCGRFMGLWFRLARWTEKKLLPRIPLVIKWLWKKFCGMILRLFRLWERFANWIGRIFAKFFSMLPTTWQWLLTGCTILMLLFISIASRSEGMLVLCLCASFAIVLYGAHCFGSLLKSAKDMSKGNLSTKVDNKLMVGSFKDFSNELNNLADVAVVAAQKQLKSERMKTELITNVSHDIKTPLTSIINYVDLLQKPHTDEEQQQYLEVLDRQSQRLKKLIDDLMDMSKASTGNMSVEITRVDAVESVNQALGEFADKLDRALLSPVFRRPEDPVYMLADGKLVWRILSNLLSNAVKYAHPGTRLYIDLQEMEGKVILSLKNISREELNLDAEELMERFVRGDASRNTEGSGLGLNIAKSLMELQKGQLQLLVDGDLFKVTLIFPGA